MKNVDIVQAFYNWYRRTLRNTKYSWIIVLATLGYLFLPFDIAPDFLPIIGWIDDGVVVTLLVAEVSQIVMEQLNKRRVNRSKSDTVADAHAVDAQPIDVPVK
ncbi:MAG: YkvA family protein [Leptolyngbyaceae bacterium]|nr:YkvA family protein [Leptolyngbyaceae bacterium]